MAKRMTRVEKTEKKKGTWDNQEFLSMCSWIERELFDYDENQKLQKQACLRLQGLKKGKVIANNKTKDNGSYSIECVFNTFKANKEKILKALKYKTFKDENNKMAYICAIVRGNINDMYIRMKDAQLKQEQSKNIQIEHQTSDAAEYKTQTNTTNNKINKDIYEEIW